jgi:hypothetical protein
MTPIPFLSIELCVDDPTAIGRAIISRPHHEQTFTCSLLLVDAIGAAIGVGLGSTAAESVTQAVASMPRAERIPILTALTDRAATWPNGTPEEKP